MKARKPKPMKLLAPLTFEHAEKEGMTAGEFKDLPRLYRWCKESLKAFRAKFGATSNLQALEAIDRMKAELEQYRQNGVHEINGLSAAGWKFRAEVAEAQLAAPTPKPGHAIFHGNGGYEGEQEEAAGVFVVGQSYKVIGGTIGRYDTRLQFEGIPKSWNSALFHCDIAVCPLHDPYL